ncbi:hypothetical protein HK102_011336, partial [Quaeritorhiza haematococci]
MPSTTTRSTPSTADFFGMAYSPYHPSCQVCLAPEEIDFDFDILSRYTSRIRTYGFDCKDAMRHIFELSASKNVELFLGLWIENDEQWEGELQTMLELIREVKGAKIYAISVGNEAILVQKQTAEQVVQK